MIEVELTRYEVKQCLNWGFDWEMDSKAAGRRHHFEPRTLWEHQIIGIMGELAVHKWLQVAEPYQPNTWAQRHVGDVSGFEVRTRRSPTSQMSVSPGYPPTRKWILALVLSHTKIGLVGWISGKEALAIGTRKQNDLNRPISLMVPQEQLRPMETLMAAELADRMGAAK